VTPDVTAFEEALVVVIRVLGVEVGREVSYRVVVASAVSPSVVESAEVSVAEVASDVVASFSVEEASEVVVLSVEEDPADVVAVESPRTKHLWTASSSARF
jgi:hypothetical protein